MQFRFPFPLRPCLSGRLCLAGLSWLIGTTADASSLSPWLLGNAHCSATLITPRVALTSQRCVEGWPHHSFHHRPTHQWQTGVAVPYPRRRGPLGDLALVLFDTPFGDGMPTTVPIPSYHFEQRLLSDPTPMSGEGSATTLAIFGRDPDPGSLGGSARRRTTYVADTDMPLTYRSFAGIRAWSTSDALYGFFFFKYGYFWQSAPAGVYELLYETPTRQGGLAFDDSDTDDLIVGFTAHTAGWGRYAVSPVDADDRGGAILAYRNGGERLVGIVSGTVVHPRLSAYWPWVYKTLMARGMRDEALQLARKVLGTGRWGDNDCRGRIGDLHVYENPYNGEVAFFRLAALDGDGRYWYFPTGRTDNDHWEYLGTDLPDKLQATMPVQGWGANDLRGTVGDVFIYANPHSNRVEYFRLKALDSDGRYWLLPTDAGESFWWTYLGTDRPTRALKFVE